MVAVTLNKEDRQDVIKSGKNVVIEHERYRAQMDVEDFIPCVLMAQMPIDSPMEALKAQAVVIRTYILHEMGAKKKIKAQELGLKYITYEKLKEMWFMEYKRNNINSATGIIYNMTGFGSGIVYRHNLSYLHTIISKTSMHVLTKNGDVILPLFHYISNGTTRDGKSLLGEEYSYLNSVKVDSDIEEENYLSSNFYTLDAFEKKLKDNGIIIYKDNGELFSKKLDLQQFMQMVQLSKIDANGYVLEVKIGDTVILGDDFAKALGLRSTAMDINLCENKIRITTKGQGHGFGLSISYAKQMAAQGKNWQEILKIFYDATIE